MDANFRLKSRLRSLTKDPNLGLGMSYFVDNGPYSDFVKYYVDQDEVCIHVCIVNRVADRYCRFRLALVSRRY